MGPDALESSATTRISILDRTRWADILKLYDACDQDFVLPLSKRSISAEDMVEGVFAHGEYLGMSVGTPKGSILGACGGYRLLDDARAEIHGVIVHPDHRGKGYGRHVIRNLIDRITSMGRDRIEVSTWEESAGLSLFNSLGFREVLRYEDPGKRPHGIRTVTLHYDAGG